jgi:glycosyltransferase involved in cell wall biosynthesis
MLRIPGYTRQLRWLFRQPDVNGVTVSKTMKDLLVYLGVPEDRLTPIYIGTDVEFFSPATTKRVRGDAAPFVLLQVSNFVPKKGHAETVRALGLLRRRRPTLAGGVRLVFVGDGPTRMAVSALVDELGLRDVVNFAGPADRHAVRDHMRRADAFVHHSVTADDGDAEGIPTVLMEALAMGLPVVSTRHSGIPELVRHGVDGLLVAERDTAAYADAIEQIVSHEHTFGGEASRRRIMLEFNIELQSQELVALYTRLARFREEPAT